MTRKFTKHTHGFVSQTFELIDGSWVCTGQDFTCGDQCEYEDEFLDHITPDMIQDEPYEPFIMADPNPKMVWWIICEEGGVKPELRGPYDEETAKDLINRSREYPGNAKNSYSLISVPDSVEIEL